MLHDDANHGACNTKDMSAITQVHHSMSSTHPYIPLIAKRARGEGMDCSIKACQAHTQKQVFSATGIGREGMEGLRAVSSGAGRQIPS